MERAPLDNLLGSRAVRRLGRYTLLARMAVGEHAEIHLASVEERIPAASIEPGALVALRQTKPEVASDIEYARLVLAEGVSARRLDHAAIARTYDVDRSGIELYSVAELLPGQTLASLVQRLHAHDIVLPVDVAVWLATELLGAVVEATNKPWSQTEPGVVVHGAIGPRAVMLTYEGRPKVLGFGHGRARASRAPGRGALPQVAPELLLGEAPDRRTDLYSVGLTIFELLSGHKLFPRASHAELREHILRGEGGAVLRALTGRVPHELAQAVERMVSRARERRPRNPEEAASALEPFAAPARDAERHLEELMAVAFRDERDAQRRQLEAAERRADQLRAGSTRPGSGISARPGAASGGPATGALPGGGMAAPRAATVRPSLPRVASTARPGSGAGSELPRPILYGSAVEDVRLPSSELPLVDLSGRPAPARRGTGDLASRVATGDLASRTPDAAPRSGLLASLLGAAGSPPQPGPPPDAAGRGAEASGVGLAPDATLPIPRVAEAGASATALTARLPAASPRPASALPPFPPPASAASMFGERGPAILGLPPASAPNVQVPAPAAALSGAPGATPGPVPLVRRASRVEGPPADPLADVTLRGVAPPRARAEAPPTEIMPTLGGRSAMDVALADADGRDGGLADVGPYAMTLAESFESSLEDALSRSHGTELSVDELTPTDEAAPVSAAAPPRGARLEVVSELTDDLDEDLVAPRLAPPLDGASDATAPFVTVRPRGDDDTQQLERVVSPQEDGRPASLPPGEAPRYHRTRRLSVSGECSVYLAEDHALTRAVVLKTTVLEDGVLPTLNARERTEQLRLEARVAAQALHPALPTLLDAGPLGADGFYLAYAVAPGRRADVLVADDGALPASAVRALVRELAAPLGALHRAGLVHGDVQLANVLVDGELRPRIVDLTAARPWPATPAPRTRAARLAPETARGLPYGPRGELVALAVLGASLWAGRPLDLAEARAFLASSAASDAGLAEALGRAIVDDPAARPESAAELAALLDARADAGRAGALAWGGSRIEGARPERTERGGSAEPSGRPSSSSRPASLARPDRERVLERLWLRVASLDPPEASRDGAPSLARAVATRLRADPDVVALVGSVVAARLFLQRLGLEASEAAEQRLVPADVAALSEAVGRRSLTRSSSLAFALRGDAGAAGAKGDGTVLEVAWVVEAYEQLVVPGDESKRLSPRRAVLALRERVDRGLLDGTVVEALIDHLREVISALDVPPRGRPEV